MIKIPGDRICYFDVDDTLVMWNPTKEELDERGICITCPGSYVIVDKETNEVSLSDPWTERLLPHRKHIEAIKKHKARGHTIVVWSAGGVDWAEAAVKALGLEQFVDLVVCKPSWAYDDVTAAEIITKIQWLKDE